MSRDRFGGSGDFSADPHTTDPNAAGLAEAELDRLADHLAGVLDQVDADEVDRLVAEDARWAAAWESLVGADAAVRAALAGVDAVGPMPDDIAARLDGALRDLARTPWVSSSPLSSVDTPDAVLSDAAPSTGSPKASHSVTHVRNVSSLAAARARRRRLLTNITVAAAALVAVVGGLTVVANLAGTRNTTTSAKSASDGAAGAGAQIPPAAAPTGPTLIASGTDYTLNTLGDLSASRPESDSAKAPAAVNGFSSPLSRGAEVGQLPATVRERAPAMLARLLDPAALSTCLDAVLAGTPGVVVTVDYALFSGQPALVVLVQRGGSSTAVAVGPECGLGGPDRKGIAAAP